MNLDEIAKGYDKILEDSKNLISMIRKDAFNKFISHVEKYNNVLEIGLGDGIFTQMLAERFKKVFAVDGSQITIEDVKNKLSQFKNITYIHSYIENLTLNQKVDNIVMSHLLEHLENPVLALIHLKEIMHKDTILYILVPNALSIHRQVAVKMGLLKEITDLNERDIKLGHKRVYKPDEFKKDVLEAGLKIIEFGGSMIKPLTNKQIEESWTPEMIEGFIKLGDDYPELCVEIYVVAKLK